ncbi:hypothetical protein M422DRAFT_259718 [Sphaerobolus stellatus SS14]|uniref:Unplaced genomic scaffold SPHSTscaffold_650, whole genome shotgun sequence n=1 Tax=Sphaerobolus stellatus (strain SS14) TaxID=990650 RepID=A0A0C9VK84_SPHS4|nr:hypothetical protein M422DRAFT_276142 [Sphaerobolus stellatus SS14]KIJ37846.1 hypothetical protein M422DRAFT_259718 [Sphaerobolus stellatus SS14]
MPNMVVRDDNSLFNAVTPTRLSNMNTARNDVDIADPESGSEYACFDPPQEVVYPSFIGNKVPYYPENVKVPPRMELVNIDGRACTPHP